MKKLFLIVSLLFLSSCYTTNPYYNMDEWEPRDDPQYEQEEGEPEDFIEEDNKGVV